jgi:hypothetical protein
VASRSQLDRVTALANTDAKFIPYLTGFYIKVPRQVLE